MRGISNRIVQAHPSRERSSRALETTKLCPCTTKREELRRVLVMRGIKLSNFMYKFSIPEGLHRLCKTTEDSFLLPLHAFEDGMIAQSVSALLERNTWLHGVADELGLILLGFKEKLINFFYRFYEISLHLFALAASSQGESGRSKVNLLTTPTDYRIVADAGIDCSSGKISSDTDSVFREINKAMDMDLVVGGPFDARRVDLNAFGENSPDFYLDEDPIEDNNVDPLVVSDNEAPYAENDIAPLLLWDKMLIGGKRKPILMSSSSSI
ncbi:hypothetical protein GOBAR_DD21035 [Gossypium barbadense]|nr:hypothetical protein GOBAR_DD21035 [Gossypium barbadense]